MPFEIEKGVPIPDRRKPGYYPWAEMKVGDSFVVPIEKREDMERVRAAAYNWAKNHYPFKFVTRKVPAGFRIWRIE